MSHMHQIRFPASVRPSVRPIQHIFTTDYVRGRLSLEGKT